MMTTEMAQVDRHTSHSTPPAEPDNAFNECLMCYSLLGTMFTVTVFFLFFSYQQGISDLCVFCFGILRANTAAGEVANKQNCKYEDYESITGAVFLLKN